MTFSETYRALSEQRAYQRAIEARGVSAILEPYVAPFIPAQRSEVRARSLA